MKAKRSPLVNKSPHWLQRSASSWLKLFVCLEQTLSPDDQLRCWLRQNARVCAWLIIPAVLVMPVIGLILWQLTGWLSMLTSIFGHMIGLPIFILTFLIVVRNITAFTKR